MRAECPVAARLLGLLVEVATRVGLCWRAFAMVVARSEGRSREEVRLRGFERGTTIDGQERLYARLRFCSN